MMHWRDAMDPNQKVLVEVEVWQLKTIESGMQTRQARMIKIIREAEDTGDYTFVEPARIEADKSYRVGRWAGQIIESLAPGRIDDEWTQKDGKLQRAAALADAMDI